MNILIACECSGRVRDAFIAKGHNAWSCDLLPSETPGPHLQEDVTAVLAREWDTVIAFPPCTHLCVSGARHFAQKRENGKQQQGIDFFMQFANCSAPRVAIENPVGIMSSVWRQPTQIIQPYEFGEPFSKKTCLWLKNMPRLTPTNVVERGEQTTYASGRSMPKWYADAFSLPPKERAKIRSRTFQGIANAMAEQWSNL